MFFHGFKYFLLQLVRNKVMIFWTMLFPIMLGTMFYFAFGNLYNATEIFDEIPIAVVSDEGSTLRGVLDTMSEGESPLFETQYTTEEEALELLKKSEIKGIIIDGDEPKLKLLSGSDIEKSIIKSFLDQYNSHVKIITEIAAAHPEKLQSAIDALSAEISSNESANYTDGNVDVYVQFFYNLIAMACLYASMSGMYISILNQANLSDKGARINVAPSGKITGLLSSLLATMVVQFAGILIATVYILFVLGIDFNVNFGVILLVDFIGVTLGVTLGFFVGCFGRMSENAKRGILLGVTMTLSFLSGLMAGSVRILVQNALPWLNKVSPVDLITDAL